VITLSTDKNAYDNPLPGTKLFNHVVTVEVKEGLDAHCDKGIAIVANENLATSIRETTGNWKQSYRK